MNDNGLMRFDGRVAAFGVYGLPAIRLAMPSRRHLFLFVLAGIVLALLATGVIDLGGVGLMAGPVAFENEATRKARQRRGEIVHEQRAMLAAAKGGVLSTEDDTRYDALTREDETLQRSIALEERDHALSEPLNDPTRPEPRTETGDDAPRAKRTATAEYGKAFTRFLSTGTTRGLEMVEERATADGLQADADTAGGFAIAPQQFVNTLIAGVDNEVAIRRLATVQRVESTASLGAPSLDADPEDGDWTQELTTVDFDSQMEFGKRELRPHELTKGIKVSRKLLRLSSLGVDGIVVDRLTYKLSVTQETAFMTGNGVNRPLGIFTASADGVPTSQDTTASATTSWTGDNLIDTQYSLKAQYQARGIWIMHRLGVRNTRKLKDGNGQYLWQPGLQGGQPDTINGRPYIQSEYAPSTFTTGLYVAAFCDPSKYWIADAEDVSIQRLVELYAASNQIGFIARSATDGMPVLAEAFARLVLA